MLLIAILVALSAGLTLVLIAVLALRKRLVTGDPQLVGKLARVETALTPHGTVIVSGELWPARSIDGLVIPAQRAVNVVGVDDIYLLVEATR